MTVSPWPGAQQRKLELARRRLSHRIIRALTRTDQSQIYTVSYHTLMMIFCSLTDPKRESPNIRSRQSDTRNLKTGESSTQKKTELMLLPLPSGMTHHLRDADDRQTRKTATSTTKGNLLYKTWNGPGRHKRVEQFVLPTWYREAIL